MPLKDAFYSKLSKSHISEKDYLHVNKVWDTFNIKTFGKYYDLYLLTDVLLLTDVFEKFHELCMSYYELEACCYYTTPGITGNASLKIFEIELDLISNHDIYIFIEKGIFSGITGILTRYVKVNNKYMKDYDNTIESSYIILNDANNLYEHSMSQPLLYHGFK